MIRDRTFSAFSTALAAASCTRTPAARRPASTPESAHPPGYYEVGGAIPEPLAHETLEEAPQHTVERVLLPPRVPRDLTAIPLAPDPIELFHYRPVGAPNGARPLLLLSPILGNTLLLVDRFAADFARRGFHAVIVQRKELAFCPQRSIRQAEEETRLVVMRSRQALDWLAQRDDVDAQRMGTFGISAGGIVSSMLAGADERLRAHVWLLAGGPLTDVIVDTRAGMFRDYARQTLAATGMRREEARAFMRSLVRTDPILLAPKVPTENVLMFLARWDQTVPYKYGLALWRALGRPELVTTPFGHYSTFILLPWLQSRSSRFLAERFGGTEPG